MSEVRPTMEKQKRSGRRARCLLAGVAVLCILAAAEGSPSAAFATDAPNPDELRAFVGRYQFLDSARDRQSYQEGIDRTVNSLNALIRGIARGQITDNVHPERTVTIETPDATHVRIHLDDWVSPPVSTNGEARRAPGPDGNPTQYSVRFRSGHLNSRAGTAEGARENSFSLGPAGNYLFMQVRVTSARLRESIRYTLTYRRRS